MSRCFATLEKAIVEKALREPAFMACLLLDPMGFLKGLAGGAPYQNGPLSPRAKAPQSSGG